MEPVPDGAVQAEGAVAGVTAQVQVALMRAAGKVSVTWALSAVDGPLLLTVTVYVVLLPATRVVTPSVLEIARSVFGTTVEVSVAVLLVELASKTSLGLTTDALLRKVPAGVFGSTVATTVMVATAAGARSTARFTLPVPVVVPQAPPLVALQLQVAASSELGRRSVTVAPVTAEGPLLVTVIV